MFQFKDYGQKDRKSHYLFQFNEAVVGHLMREQVAEMIGHMLQIEVLQATEARIVEQNHNNHDFCLRQRTVALVIAPFCLFESVFFPHCIKNLQKSSAIQKNIITLF